MSFFITVKRGKHNLLLLALTFLVAFTGEILIGQSVDITFKSLSTKDGLPQSSVVDLYHDNDGFIWFGTYNGISRFDGYSFKNYMRFKDDTTGLTDNQIRVIEGYRNNMLLVGTEKGFNIFNTHTETFARFLKESGNPNSLSNNMVFDILIDDDDEVWLATWGGGLCKFNDNGFTGNDFSSLNASFSAYKPIVGDKNSISSLKTADVDQAPDGGPIWIATLNGLNRFDKETEEFTVYNNDPNNVNSASSDNVSAVCVDKRGLVWFGTWGEGLNVLNPRTDEIIRFYNDPSDDRSISNNIVMTIYTDRKGDLWIGTWGGGLCKVVYNSFGDKPEEISFVSYQNDRNNTASISGNLIYCIYEDRHSQMWVGTDWSGVNRFVNEDPIFNHVFSKPGSENGLSNNMVFSIMKSQKGDVWVGTQEGVSVFNFKKKLNRQYKSDPTNPNSLSSDLVKSIIEDSDGNIYLAGLRGICRYNEESDNFDRVYVDHNELFALCAASDGTIWAGSYGRGLYRYNPQDRTMRNYLLPVDNKDHLNDNVIWAIIEGRDSTIWIGSNKAGLYNFNPKTEEFQLYRHINGDTTSLSHNTVHTLFIDKNGSLWIGTELGLNKLVIDENGESSFVVFTKEDGLPANYITGITEDQFDNLWVTTTNGLSRFNLQRKEYINFDLDDGIQDNEFYSNAIFADKEEGVIYAGGINGFNYFNPEEVQIDLTPPVTRITSLRIFNKEVEVGQKINGRQLLSQSISASDSIELSYTDKVISFNYAALYYPAPEGCMYAFMLEGFEDNWNYVQQQRLATYTNLKPGKYTFKVKATNADNVWNNVPTKLFISIKPPWYGTWIFRISLVLGLVSIAVLLYQMRINILKARQKDLEEKVRQRTEDLNELNVVLEEKQEEISIQNEQLTEHRNNLERLVEERTVELNDAKERAEESDRLKSSFLANMSHEVRTPMNAIMGFSNLLDDDELSYDDRKHFIEMIANNGESLMNLFNNILDISKIQSSQLKLFKEEFGVEQILEEIHKFFEATNSKDLSINLQLSEHNTYLFNDSTRFRQIVFNLVDNAIKYTEQGEVNISYKEIDGRFELYVVDTGIGISREDQQSIFNDFHKVDDDVTKLYRGVGVGLSICKNLVDLMGGSIYVESEPGKGSKFTVILPAILKRKVDSGPVVDADDLQHKSGFDIVIAEDEQTNFDLIKRILKKTEARLHWAHHGEEAVEIVRKMSNKNNCLVLMDIKMPVMDGFEAFDLIKRHDSSVPVIAVTAYAQPAEKDKILKYGFDGYISKPLKFNELLEIVDGFYLKIRKDRSND